MHVAKIASFTSSLRLTATMCVLVCGLNASPGMATDEEPREFGPGLDLWSHEPAVAPRWETREATPDLLSRENRHREFLQGGVPLEYRSRRSPYPAATKVIIDGGRLYKSHCATCHGSKGLGDGDAGRDLTPSPAFLAYLIKRPRSVDEYLLWTISEGGV